ncbi:MAG: methionine--tRNA ligase subunit beta [Candidatus Paceibacterota bacterium]
MISFEDFKKVKMRAGTIESVEPVEGSEKLLKIVVDLGEEKRQVLSGIAKFYSAEELINKQVIVVVNLEPREMMGLESQGMILAANGETPVLISPIDKVNSGSEIT